MDEKTLNIEVSRLIDSSFSKVLLQIREGAFHSRKPFLLRSPSEKTPENIKKKLYYAKLWPSIDKNRSLRSENQLKRAQSTQNFLDFYRKYLHSQPLFLKHAEAFRLAEKASFDSKKERILSEIREIHKPHDKNELKLHIISYSRLKREAENRRIEKTDELYRSFKVNSLEGHYWRGESHKRLKQEISLQKSMFLEEKTQKKHQVKNSENLTKTTGKPPKNIRELGLNYLDFSKRYGQNRPLKTRHKSLDPLIAKPHIYKNYLCELRKKSPNNLRKGVFEAWKEDFRNKNMGNRDRYLAVLNKTEALDLQAVRLGQRVRLFEDSEARRRLNEVLVHSIEAKIAILKEL